MKRWLSFVTFLSALVTAARAAPQRRPVTLLEASMAERSGLIFQLLEVVGLARESKEARPVQACAHGGLG